MGYKQKAGLAWQQSYYVIDKHKFETRPINLKSHLYEVENVWINADQTLVFPVAQGLWKALPAASDVDENLEDDDDEDFDDIPDLGGCS